VLGTSLNETQLAKLRAQVGVAHERGIKVRYWDQPGWPVGTRDGIVSTLFFLGLSLVGVKGDLELCC
jgi:hypothetical protein